MRLVAFAAIRAESAPRGSRGSGSSARIAIAILAAGVLLGVSASSARALSPWWHLTSNSRPANLAPGQSDGELVVTAENMGDADVNGSKTPVRIVDTLPPGLKATGAVAIVEFTNTVRDVLPCTVESESRASCTFTGAGSEEEGGLPPYHAIEMRTAVTVQPAAVSGGLNRVSVSGGEAPAATIGRPVLISGEPARFGVQDYELTPESVDGELDTQAGSHPYQADFTVVMNQGVDHSRGAPAKWIPEVNTVALPKDLRFKLPPGFVGNPTAIPQCPLGRFLKKTTGPADECSAETAIGVATVNVNLHTGFLNYLTFTVPVFDLEPSAGSPARFGFYLPEAGFGVYIDASVRNGSDYGVTGTVENITQTAALLSAEVTLWGVPGDPRHSLSRGWGCLEESRGQTAQEVEQEGVPACAVSHVNNPPPFLDLSGSCTGPLQTSGEADSWADRGDFQTFLPSEPLPALDGCNRLPFSSSINVTPDGEEGGTPTGLAVGIHIPQDSTNASEGLAESAVKDTTVTLPEGEQISPAAADGLLSCSNEQVGFTGVEVLTGADQFTSGPVGCPDASKVGTDEIKTPLLPEPLTGSVYLAAQDANPFGSLIGLYLYAEDPRAGVVVKLAGEVQLNERTGQIVTVFPNSPQVPFEEARLHFFGGDRAPLSTPPLCGSYTSTASIVPWSGNEPSAPSSTFQITSGPNGSPCASPRPFQPGFEAGTTSVQAGGFSPLTLTMTRPDADQQLGKLDVVLPPGVSAGLEGVKLCEEPQAASGACPAESQIGQVIASAGLGGDPYSVETGKAYITGPYEGAPFGVDVVVPAVAGPFNLGTEVVRSKVEVDPTDAHLTVVSDAFPTMLDGIPLQLQHVNVTVNRPGFVFNPTSCEPMKLTGELESVEGATADVSTPFQVTNCAALSFKPEFVVSTEAKTSRTEGATLHVKLTLPSGAQGTKANVKEVRVSLPKQLPSPLKTLQKACTEKVFAENPSNCPVASRVGEAHVTTPVLEGGLKGPAYFVSHGGAKYPELIMVLVGEDGVTVQVHGETFISKQGITTATFSTVPDVPFSTFELELPKREYPALSANGNLCQAHAAGKLLMPTEMVGQNGDKITQSTKIAVTGCPKTTHKKASKKKTHHRAAKGKGKKKR
jgi:hypothetical protein